MFTPPIFCAPFLFPLFDGFAQFVAFLAADPSLSSYLLYPSITHHALHLGSKPFLHFLAVWDVLWQQHGVLRGWREVVFCRPRRGICWILRGLNQEIERRVCACLCNCGLCWTRFWSTASSPQWLTFARKFCWDLRGWAAMPGQRAAFCHPNWVSQKCLFQSWSVVVTGFNRSSQSLQIKPSVKTCDC